MHAVAVSAQAPHAPAFRVRAALLAPHLLGHGVALDLLPLLTSEEGRGFAAGGLVTRARIATRARQRLRHQLNERDLTHQTALIQRQVDLLPSLALERQVQQCNRVVLDVDDAIWHDGPAAGGHPLARLKRSGYKLRWLAERADHVIAGNDLLAEAIVPHAREVTVIPSLVDVEAIPCRDHDDREALVLGWIGSPTTAPYLAEVAPMLSEFARQVAPLDVELLVVGGPMAPVPGIRTRVVAWSEASERDALERIDIGLMPLPDTPWTRGKCAYKALQYMAAGIPVVADDVGVSAAVIGDGRAGRVASRRTDWPDALAELAASAAQRTRLGTEGRERVRRGFSHERWLPELAGILRGA